MYKVLVVDDEPIVSSGIKDYLLASELNISRVETALNGFEAMDYLRLDAFDLVLTDIQMSQMNGIELMEAILTEQPNLPIVVISAYEKFDFAQKSLRLGAKDYLVKPVGLQQLLRVVGQALAQKTVKSDLLWRSSQNRDHGAEWDDRSMTLLELVTDQQLSEEDLSWLLNRLDLSLAGPCFRLLGLEADFGKGGFSSQAVHLRDRKLLKYASLNVVEESLGDWRGAAFYGLGNQLLVLLQLEEDEADGGNLQHKSQVNLLANHLYRNLKDYLNLESTIGISSAGRGVRSLPGLMKEAVEAADWRALHPDHAIFHYEDQIKPAQITYSAWLADVERLLTHILSGTGEGAEVPEAEIQTLNDRLERMKLSEEMFHNCFGILTYRLFGLLLEHGQDAGVQLSRFEPHGYFRDCPIEDKMKELPVYIGEIVAALRDCLVQRDRTLIEQVEDYVRRHYGNKGLKLQDIANAVHISPTYLSYLFKKIKGRNLWDHLTDVRLQAAKRLLADTDKKRYEIAFEIGYESPEHFSRIFKKHVGTTPADFRKEEGSG